MWTVTPLGTADRPSVAQVQTESWRNTYAGILPETYIAEGMARDIAERWSRPLRAVDVLVGAKSPDGALLGFAAVLLQPAQTPYLDNLHVLPAWHGRGVADALMAAMATQLLNRGDASLCLTVVTTNARARAFYARMGGVEGEEGDDDMFGQPVRSLPVHWTDLPALSRQGKC